MASVAPGSAAAKAGLKSGDVVLEVNGEAIVRSVAVQPRRPGDPGETVKLKIWRDKAARDVEVKLGSAEEPTKVPTPAAGRRAGPARFGACAR